MGHQVTVAYYPTTMGVMQQQTGASTVYYGKVFKISGDSFSESGEIDFEREISELTKEMQKQGLVPVLDEATIERYETWDIDTKDVWVMYRVPCEPNGE